MRNIVLIVDDRPQFLATFAKQCVDWFKKWKPKLEVVARTSAKKARTFLKAEGDRVELAIVDIRLPTTTQGRNLLLYMKKNYPAIRRIAITAEADREEVGAMAAQQLFHGYIDKDWWEDSLQKKTTIRKEIKRVLDEPCDPAAHSSIVAALERWLEQDPNMRNKKLTFMSGEHMTIAEVLDEIRNGTPLGKMQERTIFRLACDLFSHKSPEGS